MDTGLDPAAALAAARRLAAPALGQGFRPEALHVYEEAGGAPSYWRIRCRNPYTGQKWIRPMHLSDGKFVLGEPPAPAAGKPLYRLPQILASEQCDPVYVVEGESCADALVSLGLLATTSGGADSCDSADWSPLAGRACVIWPDCDVPGSRYAAEVAESLENLSCDVSIVDIDALGMGRKEDCVDWLTRNPGATAEQILKLPSVATPPGNKEVPLELICAADVACRPIRWLWPGWLAAGKLHILAGSPGTGKTTIAMSMAAAVSTGGNFPDGSTPNRSRVVIWSGEDGFEDTLAPRLRFAGADMSAVYFVGSINPDGERRPFDPADDMCVLEQTLAQLGGVSLLIVDPVVSAVAGDSHRNTEVRRALQPLVDLATTLDIAVLGISHFSKSSAGRDPVERVTGSIAFGALARLVMVTAAKQDDEEADGFRVLTRAKNNIGPDGGGFEYRLERCEEDGIEASRVAWGHALEGSARALLGRAEVDSGDTKTNRERAADWLISVLAAGPTATNDIKEAAKVKGLAWRTVERAKAALGVVASRTSEDGGWVWSLALQDCFLEDRQGRQAQGLGEVGGLGGLGAEGERFAATVSQA